MKPDTAAPKWTSTISLTGYKLALGVGGCWIMDKVPIEIRSIVGEIEKAINSKLYYLAIAVALSIPDICACLEFDPDNPRRANQDTYAEWCDRNLQGRFNNLTGVDIYRLRCGVLHFGHFGHPKASFNRVMFIGPESAFRVQRDIIATVAPDVHFGGVSAAELRMVGKVLQVDLIYFCQAIMDAATQWIVSKESDPFVQRNLPNLVRYRPEGLPPFSIGVPTIA
jgi:hypothetical protein